MSCATYIAIKKLVNKLVPVTVIGKDKCKCIEFYFQVYFGMRMAWLLKIEEYILTLNGVLTLVNFQKVK